MCRETHYATGWPQLYAAFFWPGLLPWRWRSFWRSARASSSSTPPSAAAYIPQAPAQSAYQGSVANQPVTPGVLQLTIKDAVLTGLKNNLGIILSGENVNQAGGQRLQQLQKLLPTVNGTFKESVQQVNLKAEGLNIPGFPVDHRSLFAYTDVRGKVDWTLLSVPSLNNYLASRHDFEATKLSLNDARNLVALSIGYAYLACISDEANIANDEAQVASTKVSLDQANANHEAGTAPELGCAARPRRLPDAAAGTDS